MPGYLCHARRFRKEPFLAHDGKLYYQLTPDDGGTVDVSYSTWEGMKSHCETLGIPRNVWPEFSEFEEMINLPPEEVEKKNPVLREALARLSEEAIASHNLLLRIVYYIRRGELIFFC
jgi:hypothetical protein